MSAPQHPVWSLLRLAVVMVALCVTLWVNASQFDATEIKSIVTMFLVAAGAEGVSQLLGGKK